MSTYFTPGIVYSNSPTQYGLRPYDSANDFAALGMPVVTMLCVGTTRTSATFKRLQPTGSGATANPGMLTGETLRLPLRQDSSGLYVAPFGRRAQAPILRPTPAAAPDLTFWTANSCVPDGSSIQITAIGYFYNQAFTQRTGVAASWSFDKPGPYYVITPDYSGSASSGVYTVYACIQNATAAAAAPKLIFAPTNNAATVTGTISVEWNGLVLRSVTNGTLDLASLGTILPPVPVAAGTAAVCSVVIRCVNITSASGRIAFGMSL